METITISSHLILSAPDGFRKMTEEELSNQSFYKQAPQWAVTDPDRHMILSAASQTLNGFSALLLNAKDIVKQSSQKLSDLLKPYGYRADRLRTVAVGGEPGEALRYYYCREGIEMTGDMIVVKKGKTVYHIYSYMRTEAAGSSSGVLSQLLEEAEWK